MSALVDDADDRRVEENINEQRQLTGLRDLVQIPYCSSVLSEGNILRLHRIANRSNHGTNHAINSIVCHPNRLSPSSDWKGD
jgi:hypothetical protein